VIWYKEKLGVSYEKEIEKKKQKKNNKETSVLQNKNETNWVLWHQKA
jgi:hypothetical protein